MQQWSDSDGTVMLFIWALLCHFEGMEMSLIIFYPFAMPWKCGKWSGGGTIPTAKNSDRTVMRQWFNGDAMVMEQWCLWFELYYVTLKVWRCHWSYFILFECLGSVITDLVVAQDPLPKAVTKQWWNSDATVMRQWCLWFELYYVTLKVWRCHGSYFILLQCLWNSYQTLMRQWWNSDATVMPLIWAPFCGIEGSVILVMIIFSLHGGVGPSAWCSSFEAYCLLLLSWKTTRVVTRRVCYSSTCLLGSTWN
jgi:hypothetical protein